MPMPEHIGFYINATSKHIRRHLDSIFYEYEHLTGTQACVLGEISHAAQEGRPYYQKNIEHHFGMRRSSANSLISSMEQNGYLTRDPVKEDARLKRLVLTEKGQETSDSIQQRLDNFEASLASLYTEEEQQQLLTLLKRLIDQVPDPKCTSCSNTTHQERM